MLEIDELTTPTLAITEQLKPTSIERVKRVRDCEAPLQVVHIGCSYTLILSVARREAYVPVVVPARKNVSAFLANIREIITSHPTAKTVNLIQMLNPKIRGWANYCRHVVASHVFNYVDHRCYEALDRWVQRRHPNKNRHWQQSRYYCQVGGDRWRFFAPIRLHGKPSRVLLVKASSVKIRRHVKVRAQASPFDPLYREYFAKRSNRQPLPSFSLDAGSIPTFGKA